MDHSHGNRAAAPAHRFQELDHLVVRRIKLARPLLSAEIIPRPRLIAQLDEALRYSLTLVIGPAGFGKTTALVAWAGQLAAPVAWLALDQDDNDLVRFASHLLASLQSIAPDVGRVTSNLIRLPAHPPPAVIGMQIADELLDVNHELVLILDDFHLISDPGVLALIEALIRFPPPALHLVLGSRVDPPLPTNLLRGRGHLVELRASDLRFTDHESRQYFAQVSQGSLSAEIVELLEERLEGWPAGLRLAWLALRDQPATYDAKQVIANLFQSPVREYLIEEFVSRQPAAIEDFLLRTSILERICAPLCETLVAQERDPGWSQDVLDELARGNPFLTALDHNRVWYRYHQLLRQVLLHRLRLQHGEEGVNMLHRRASTWFAEQGLIDEAVQHSLTGGDGDTAASLVEAHVHAALHTQNWLALGGWLRQLPADLVLQRPGLLLARAWHAELGGHLPDMETCLTDIELLLADRGTITDDERNWIALSAETLRVAIAASRTFLTDYPLGSDDAEAGTLASLTSHLHAEAKAIADAVQWPERDAHVAASSWMWGSQFIYRALSLQALGQAQTAVAELRDATRHHEGRIGSTGWGLLMAEGVVHLMEGQLAQVEFTARRLLQTATRENLKESLAWAHWFLGIASYEQNDLRAASEHLAQVETVSDYAHNVALHEGRLANALTLQALGQFQEAQIAIGQLIAQLEAFGMREHLVTACSLRARLALMQRDPATAQEWLADPVSAPVHRRIIFVESVLLTRAWVVIASSSHEDREQAIRVLKQLQHDSESAHRHWLHARVLALLALAFDAQGLPDAAFSTIQEAVALAAPRGLIRTFVDYGGDMERLLRRFSRYAGSSQFVSRVLAAFPSWEQQGAAAVPLTRADDELIERVSDRELEVLRLMHQHLTNHEIGERLYISPLTVKRHTINIYGKLGVSSRRAAVLKGSALGLIPRA